MLNKTVLFILFTFFYGGTLSQDLNCLKFDPPDLSFDTIYLDPQKKEAKFEWQVSVINPTDHTIKIERILPSSSNMVAQSKKKLL
ncbi:MAG: hypothetical protein MRY83_15930, partial [Flavobacteriales bacterium]|nr:hypothetical protein [Flavobacteriales bacterium]